MAADKGAGGSDVLEHAGDNDQAVAPTANPTTDQVTQQGGRTVPAEGHRIRQAARDRAEESDAPVTLDTAVFTDDSKALTYDDTGRLVNRDGKPIAMSADALDPDVGWNVQHARAAHEEDERELVAYPGGPATVPDQTVHPKELPDPVAAIRAGLLPQNAEVLNVDPDKFKGKKSLEA